MFDFFKKKKGEKKMKNLDEILASLSKEDRLALKSKLLDLDKAEDEREIDKIEEEKADNVEIASEKAKEVKEESEEIGKDVENLENKAEKVNEKQDETIAENADKSESNDDQHDKRFNALDERLSRIEEAITSLMQDKQAQTSVEDKAKETYGLGNGVFAANETAPETKRTSGAEIASMLNKIKR